jgi:hypothetical protein
MRRLSLLLTALALVLVNIVGALSQHPAPTGVAGLTTRQ